MQNKNVTLRPVHVRRESNQCLAIRNATHWADTRSIERISCYVVICMFTCFTVSACYCMVGLINITYFVDSETKLTRPKLLQCFTHNRTSLDVCKKSFYRAANAVFGKVGRTATEEVTLQLVLSKCVSVLLFCLKPVH